MVSEENAINATEYVLDLSESANVFAWRLRAEPDILTAEIDEFHHGDRIRATSLPAHPGWLKLVGKRGWVKESHEDHPVWKLASSMDLDEPSSSAAESSSSAAVSDDLADKGIAHKKKALESDCEEPSITGSSGSQSGPVNRAVMPIPFTGKCYAIGRLVDDNQPKLPSATVPTKWFTGQSCKLPGTRIEASKPRWADISDEDTEDTPWSVKPVTIAESLESTSCGSSCVSEPLDLVAMPSEVNVVRNPNRQARNKSLLKKRNKTQLCRYVAQDGCCPFSETCWFAHSAEELRMNSSC
jgi:hypothetical protein